MGRFGENLRALCCAVNRRCRCFNAQSLCGRVGVPWAHAALLYLLAGAPAQRVFWRNPRCVIVSSRVSCAQALSACDGLLVRGLVPLWAMQLGAGSMLVVVLLFNFVPCVRHPGYSDEETWEEASAPPRAVEPMEHSRTMQGGALRADAGTELARRQD